MTTMSRVFFLCSSLVLSVIAIHKPSYIVPCHKTPDFNECAVKNAKIAIPHLLEGDRRLSVPPMNPLKLELLDLQGATNFNLSMKNIEIYGLDGLEVLKFVANFDNMSAVSVSTVPRLLILGEYTITGNLLLFSLNGHGPLNITLLNGIYEYNFDWTLEKRDGEEYAKLINTSFDYKLKDVSFDLPNIISGDKILSKAVNKILNENWEIVNEDLRESLTKSLLAIYNDIFGKIFPKIPYKELFLD
ncbi:hypothetical protein JTB14_023905 [Gonioctena quinquepunctata]|nr:hypothetical protein JTB14_023905 [Gonioctena quinquepunctata]